MFRKIDSETVEARPITMVVDGEVVAAEQGEPVAALLLRIPPHTTRLTAVSGTPRAPYCMMGICFECLVEIDGTSSTRSCVTRAREGMIVRRQAGRPDPLEDTSIG